MVEMTALWTHHLDRTNRRGQEVHIRGARAGGSGRQPHRRQALRHASRRSRRGKPVWPTGAAGSHLRAHHLRCNLSSGIALVLRRRLLLLRRLEACD